MQKFYMTVFLSIFTVGLSASGTEKDNSGLNFNDFNGCIEAFNQQGHMAGIVTEIPNYNGHVFVVTGFDGEMHIYNDKGSITMNPNALSCMTDKKTNSTEALSQMVSLDYATRKDPKLKALLKAKCEKFLKLSPEAKSSASSANQGAL